MYLILPYLCYSKYLFCYKLLAGSFQLYPLPYFITIFTTCLPLSQTFILHDVRLYRIYNCRNFCAPNQKFRCLKLVDSDSLFLLHHRSQNKRTFRVHLILRKIQTKLCHFAAAQIYGNLMRTTHLVEIPSRPSKTFSTYLPTVLWQSLTHYNIPVSSSSS